MPRRRPTALLLAALAVVVLGFALTRGASAPPDRPAPRAAGPAGTRAITLPAEVIPERDAAAPSVRPAAARGTWRARELRRLRRSRTVRGALRRVWVAGLITREAHDGWRSDLWRAERAARRLGGVRGANQRASLGVLRRLAARRALTSGRLPLAFLQLRRNTAWWTRHGPPGRDVTWGSDPVTLRPVAGAGLVVHHLATWGRVNALAGRCLREPAECPRLRLRGALARLVALGAPRSGGLAWEHLFGWHGGAPGWVSGMVQGTAVQALARGGEVLGERRWVRAASRAMVLLERRPPTGVGVPAPGGRHYLMYSFQPGLRILNGFLQTLVGLRDMAALHDSARARRLYRSGERAARRMLARADTGAWSLYAAGGRESTLGYHRLTGDFLRGLCRRTGRGAWCAARRRFARYEREPPRIGVATARRPRAGTPTIVRFSLSKLAKVAVEVRGPGGGEWRRVLSVTRGRHQLTWRPARRGVHRLRVLAQGPSGPRGVARRRVTVRRSWAAVRAERQARAQRRARARRRAREKPSEGFSQERARRAAPPG